MSTKQNVLLSNCNKSDLSNLNNDIILNFPSNLFYKKPTHLELINFDLECEVLLFGNSNNSLKIGIKFPDGSYKVYLIVVEFKDSIKTDYDLAIAIKTALNLEDYDGYDIVFDVTESTISNVITNFKVEIDTSTTSYSITCSKPCNIMFDHKDSIGMLIGFGSGIYENVTQISGISTQSITAYNYIDSYNESSDTGIFPNYNDVNCKMAMFDSFGMYIPNKDNDDDVTVSINKNLGVTHYDSIGQILIEIENAMNEYSNIYSPPAVFDVSYDYKTDKTVIVNKTGAKFGIGFDFDNIANIVTSGSLHTVLGFEQKSYVHLVSIESPGISLTFENTFSDDYILICSDLSNNSSDLSIIGIGNANNIKSNDILFAIPYKNRKQFKPVDSSFYRVNISSSPFSMGYKNKIFNETNPNLVNFYLRTLSGRCISSNCQWTALIAFNF